ncbi:auxin response factor 23-like [Lolium rigidum]|uniref:auxin response factor 23-like n=1 Tax=Lolium rigidum TaxID=89674 RepID=UPI001F5C4553|nr:auxin response factor 23-like [Lolium rigidum]XP_047086462.1 auxin response factor 23-like [Lolium rigidum]XP_047086463.1 auxin response factor 23-like [Lolium rigidum]
MSVRSVTEESRRPRPRRALPWQSCYRAATGFGNREELAASAGREQVDNSFTEEVSATPWALPMRSCVHSLCKTLTASDTSTHGGFSVRRRHSDECFSTTGYEPSAFDTIAHIFRDQDKWERYMIDQERER